MEKSKYSIDMLYKLFLVTNESNIQTSNEFNNISENRIMNEHEINEDDINNSILNNYNDNNNSSLANDNNNAPTNEQTNSKIVETNIQDNIFVTRNENIYCARNQYMPMYNGIINVENNRNQIVGGVFMGINVPLFMHKNGRGKDRRKRKPKICSWCDKNNLLLNIYKCIGKGGVKFCEYK